MLDNYLILQDVKCSDSEPIQLLLINQINFELPKLSHLSLHWPVLETTLL